MLEYILSYNTHAKMAIVACKVNYSKFRSSSESIASEGDPSSISSETATRSGGTSPAAHAALYHSTASMRALRFSVFRVIIPPCKY